MGATKFPIKTWAIEKPIEDIAMHANQKQTFITHLTTKAKIKN